MKPSNRQKANRHTLERLRVPQPWLPMLVLPLVLLSSLLSGCSGMHEGGVYEDRRVMPAEEARLAKLARQSKARRAMSSTGEQKKPAVMEPPSSGDQRFASSVDSTKRSEMDSPLDSDARKSFDEAITAYRAGNYAQALASFNTVARRYPEKFGPRFNALLALQHGGKSTEALRQARRLEKTFPRRAELRNLIALLVVENGDFEAAREALEGARVTENLPETHYNLGLLCENYFADSDCARKHYRQYLGLHKDNDKRVSAWLGTLQGAVPQPR